MAPKRRSPSPSEESSSDDEPATAAIPNQRKPGANPPSKSPPPPKKRADSDEEESDESSYEESGSDAERSTKPPPLKTKPQIQQKPQHTPVPALPRPAPNPADPSSDEDESSEEEDGEENAPPVSHGQAQLKLPDSGKPKKSPLATVAGTEPQKKQKKKQEAFSEPPLEPKMQPFKRLWGDEDVVAILHGLLDYRFKMGALPASSQDFESFHAFVRRSLSIEVNKLQLSEKVRKLRKKFQDTATRQKNGADTFTNPHDGEVFELSKKIWGAQNHGVESNGSEGDDSDGELGTQQNAKGETNATQITGKSQVHTAPSPTVENGNSSYIYLQEAIDVLVRAHPWGPTLKRAYDFLDGSKAKALDEKFKKHRQIEIKQHLRRMDLMKEAAKALFDKLE